MNGVPQSAVIFGAFVVMFLAFITAKGELPLYMGFLFGDGSSSSSSVASAAPVSSTSTSTAPTTTPGSIGLFGIGNLVSGVSSLFGGGG